MHVNVFKFCMKWIWILVSVWFTLRILIHRLSLWGHVEEDIRTTPIGSSCTHLIHAITCLWGGFFYAGFEKPLERRIRSEEHVNMGNITIGHARKLLPKRFLNYMSHPKTHSKGMTVISHLKPKGSKWKRHKHSYCNWKFTN